LRLIERRAGDGRLLHRQQLGRGRRHGQLDTLILAKRLRAQNS
jgi:hypothetical protein